MKRIAMISLLLVALLALSGVGQTPTKLFDVRNNGTQESTDIVFKDAASKNAMIDATARVYGYQATIPDPANPGQMIANPQTKRNFYHDRIKAFLRDIYKADKVATAAKTATDSAAATAEGELPPQ